MLSDNNYERYFEISLPRNHELAQPESDAQKNDELWRPEIAFRTRATSEIRGLFGSDVFFLKETHHSGQTLAYQVAVHLHRERTEAEKEAKLETFRQRIRGLGFNVREISAFETRR